MVDRFNESDIANRFRRDSDWFVASKIDDIFVARIGAISERIVDLLPALAFHLDPAVDVVVESFRDHRMWRGSLLALPDVRDALGRLRLPLAMYGGVEVSLVTPGDQLTLTPELELVVYARSDRWLFLLEGMGIMERSHAPSAVWHVDRKSLRPIDDLSNALRAAAERLDLSESSEPSDNNQRPDASE